MAAYPDPGIHAADWGVAEARLSPLAGDAGRSAGGRGGQAAMRRQLHGNSAPPLITESLRTARRKHSRRDHHRGARINKEAEH
jgi:hypothetical protein